MNAAWGEPQEFLEGLKANDEQGDRRMPVSLSPMRVFFAEGPLFAEDENALLPGEAHFLHLSALAE
jgi:hypothetical protein